MKNYHAEILDVSLVQKKMIKLNTAGIHPVHYQRLNTADAQDKQNWEDMIAYAKTLDVPDDQCDFLPEDYTSRKYD